MSTSKDLDFLNSKASKSAPSRTDKRFDVTKTGLTGLQRDTMLQNELHFLPQLGKCRARGHILPGSDFTYGFAYERVDGGVQEALHHWASLANDSKTRGERFKLVRDYLSMNREAVKSGCATTKQNDQFRSLHDIKKKIKIGGASSDGLSRHQVSFPADMTFGMPNRPSTPINDVLESRFLHEWLSEAEKLEAERVFAKKESLKAISGAYHTKASWLKNAKVPVDERPLWKMPRFSKVEAAVDTFRTQAARRQAFSTNELDAVPRQGANVFQQGIYNVQTNTMPV